MSAPERNFNDYYLGDNPNELANGLLPEIARASGYELENNPTEENLKRFVGHIGPAKWLQENIELVQEQLGSEQDAVTLASDWVDRSGVLLPVNRSFTNPEVSIPKHIDNVFITGGVARWMLRRANRLVSLVDEGYTVGNVYLPIGNDEMKASEHDAVAQMIEERGTAPKQYEFAEAHLDPILKAAGLRVTLLPVEERDGDKIMDYLVTETDITNTTVLAVGNAPSVIQSAGQLRWAARKVGDFDADGSQLYMASDTIQVARHGEPASTHQNPFTALGQIARNALYLTRNSGN